MSEGNNNTLRVSARRFAALAGRSRDYIMGGIGAGWLPAESRTGARGTPEWAIHVPDGVRALEDRARREERERLEAKHAAELERFQRALAQAGDEGDVVSRPEALRRRAVCEARLAELDLAEREHKLLPIEALISILVDTMQLVLASLAGVAPRTANRLAGLSTSGECAALVQDEIGRACEAVSRVLGDPESELLREADTVAHGRSNAPAAFHRIMKGAPQ